MSKPATIEDAIRAFHSASAAYMAVIKAMGDDTPDDFPEWTAYEAAEHVVITFPCATLEDVRAKARFFLENDGPYDTIRNCFQGIDETDREETLRPFLRSLIGEASE